MVAAELLPGLAAIPAVTSPTPPMADAPAPTEDIQLTDEIRALAASLDHHPLTRFTWVYDTTEFLPTYGSIQGAHLRLQTRRSEAA